MTYDDVGRGAKLIKLRKEGLTLLLVKLPIKKLIFTGDTGGATPHWWVYPLLLNKQDYSTDLTTLPH